MLHRCSYPTAALCAGAGRSWSGSGPDDTEPRLRFEAQGAARPWRGQRAKGRVRAQAWGRSCDFYKARAWPHRARSLARWAGSGPLAVGAAGRGCPRPPARGQPRPSPVLRRAAPVRARRTMGVLPSCGLLAGGCALGALRRRGARAIRSSARRRSVSPCTPTPGGRGARRRPAPRRRSRPAPNAGPLREAGRSTQRSRRRWVSRAGVTHGKVPAGLGVRPALWVW